MLSKKNYIIFIKKYLFVQLNYAKKQVIQIHTLQLIEINIKVRLFALEESAFKFYILLQNTPLQRMNTTSIEVLQIINY